MTSETLMGGASGTTGQVEGGLPLVHITPEEEGRLSNSAEDKKGLQALGLPEDSLGGWESLPVEFCSCHVLLLPHCRVMLRKPRGEGPGAASQTVCVCVCMSVCVWYVKMYDVHESALSVCV